MLQGNPAGEVNRITIDWPATNLTLQHQAGIDFAPEVGQFLLVFTQTG